MEGLGIYRWKDGRVFHGEYIDDKKQGYGIYEWQDARKYQGYWMNGKQHGLGIYSVMKEDRIKHGLWEDGKRIEWFKPESQEKVNNLELDYTQYYKSPSSKNGLPNDCTFLEP